MAKYLFYTFIAVVDGVFVWQGWTAPTAKLFFGDVVAFLLVTGVGVFVWLITHDWGVEIVDEDGDRFDEEDPIVQEMKNNGKW